MDTTVAPVSPLSVHCLSLAVFEDEDLGRKARLREMRLEVAQRPIGLNIVIYSVL